MRIFTETAPGINKFSVDHYQKTDWNFARMLSAGGFCCGILFGILGAALSLIALFSGSLRQLNFIGLVLLFSAFGLLLGGAHYLDKTEEDKKTARRRRYEDSFK
jgi:high-affinity Fe2+/Pb2+ permease